MHMALRFGMTPYCAPPNPSLTAEARSPSKSPCTTARGGRRESCQSLTTRALHHSQVEFDDVVMSFLFLIAVWVGGKAAAGMRMPSLVGELAVGLVRGPPLLDVVPLAEALMLYGEVGLLLLVRRCRPSAVRRSQWTPGIGIQKAAAAALNSCPPAAHRERCDTATDGISCVCACRRRCSRRASTPTCQ